MQIYKGSSQNKNLDLLYSLCCAGKHFFAFAFNFYFASNKSKLMNHIKVSWEFPKFVFGLGNFVSYVRGKIQGKIGVFYNLIGDFFYWPCVIVCLFHCIHFGLCYTYKNKNHTFILQCLFRRVVVDCILNYLYARLGLAASKGREGRDFHEGTLW